MHIYKHVCIIFFLIIADLVSVQSTLQWGKVTVTDKKECRFPNISSLDGLLCAKTNRGQSGLSGDSGGPLVYKSSNGNYIQIGVLSRILLSSSDDIPICNLYTNVTHFSEWISTNAE